MAIRHVLNPRASGPLKRRFPRQCILIASTPISAMLRTMHQNQAILEASNSLVVGDKVELHHAEAGMVVGQVVNAVGKRITLAFNLGNRTSNYALNALRLAVGPR